MFSSSAVGSPRLRLEKSLVFAENIPKGFFFLKKKKKRIREVEEENGFENDSFPIFFTNNFETSVFPVSKVSCQIALSTVLQMGP